MAFVEECSIDIVASMTLDFTIIPEKYRGTGYSTNLKEYLCNNVSNTSLIREFLFYFISKIIKMKYSNGGYIAFTFLNASTWQNMTFIVVYPKEQTTTTTTTTTTEPIITTTLAPTTTLVPFSFFEVFGQLYTIS